MPSRTHLVSASNALRRQAETGCVPQGSRPGHKDSWGLCWFDRAGNAGWERAVGSACDSEHYAETIEQATFGNDAIGPACVLIGHLRKASYGSVIQENAHPVRGDFASHSPVTGRRFRTLFVAHNGTLRDPLLVTLRDDLGGLVEARSDNDTVVLGAWLTTRLEQHPDTPVAQVLSDSLRELLQRADTIAEADFNGDRTRCYSALNLLMATAEGLYAFRQFSKEPNYYTLYARPLRESEVSGRKAGTSCATKTSAGWIVASERTDEAPDWNLLPPGELMHYPCESRTAR